MPLIVILLIGGAAVALLPYAFAEDSKNPIAAIWDAIYDLQNRDQNLQAQIDDLRTTKGAGIEADGPKSDASVAVEVLGGESEGQVLIHITVANSGPDRAAGVRLMVFYKMPLFHINSISGEACSDLGRGIIQCDLGTIESGEELAVTLDADALSEQETSLTADVSSTTEDLDTSNNRSVIEFAVSASGPVPVENETPTSDNEIGENSNVESNQTSTEDDAQTQEDEQGTTSGNQTSTNETNSTSTESNSNDQSDSDASSDNNANESEQSTAGTNSRSSSSESSSDNETTSSDEDDEQSEEEDEQGTSSANQTSSTG